MLAVEPAADESRHLLAALCGPQVKLTEREEEDVRYYVNKNAQANGDHEVHNLGCSFCPAAENRIYLGDFTSCHPAVRKANQYFNQVNGCYYCSNPCHTA